MEFLGQSKSEIATRGFEDKSPRSLLKGIGNFLLDRSKAFDKDFHEDKENLIILLLSELEETGDSEKDEEEEGIAFIVCM